MLLAVIVTGTYTLFPLKYEPMCYKAEVRGTVGSQLISDLHVYCYSYAVTLRVHCYTTLLHVYCYTFTVTRSLEQDRAWSNTLPRVDRVCIAAKKRQTQSKRSHTLIARE